MLGAAAFQRQFLSRSLWAKQKEICAAVEECDTVAVKGCHGSGKTFCVSGLVPYFLTAHPEAIVLVIAPTFRQVKTFWGEVADAIQKLPYRVPEPGSVRWELGPKCYAQGFSSSKGVNAQGFHGRRVLILADEAIGISGEVWDAVEGIRSAGDVTIVKLCNPTVPEGPVFEDFGRNRRRGLQAITISAFDTPNLAGLTMESLLTMSEDELDVCILPWLTRRRWVLEMYHKWGPNNPRFLARVLGEFPQQADDAVFQLAWIEKAALPYEIADLQKLLIPGVYIQIGIDVAGPGEDETACCARIGQYVVARASWVKPDAIEEVTRFLGDLKRRFPNVPHIVVGDVVGMGWHFMTQVRKALAHTDVAYGFVAGAAPINPAMFVNAKAEQYWCLREWMRDGLIHGIEDEDTRAQLADIRYRETSNGRIEVEAKDEARERGSRSPDRAEAVVMAYCRIVQAKQTTLLGGDYQISPV